MKNNLKRFFKLSKESLKINQTIEHYQLLYKLWGQLHELEEAEDIYAFEKLQWASPAFFVIVKMIQLCEFLAIHGYIPEINPDISGAASIILQNPFCERKATLIIYNDSLPKVSLLIKGKRKSEIGFSYATDKEWDRLLEDLKKHL